MTPEFDIPDPAAAADVAAEARPAAREPKRKRRGPLSGGEADRSRGAGSRTMTNHAPRTGRPDRSAILKKWKSRSEYYAAARIPKLTRQSSRRRSAPVLQPRQGIVRKPRGEPEAAL